MTPACWSWPPPNEPITTSGELWGWHRGLCAACGELPAVRLGYLKGLVEDHDHQTGLTRGYLCRRCNAREAITSDPLFDAYRSRPPSAIVGASLTYYAHERAGRAQRKRSPAPPNTR